MSEPAYHLRPNKAVERMLFVALLRKLDRRLPKPIDTYTYVGMGGPYLEDFNLFNSALGNKRMISLETEEHVITRQKLNQPCSTVKRRLQSTGDFASTYQRGRTPLLVWFDHSKPDWKNQIVECCDLLRKLPSMSVFKVTFSVSTKKLGDDPRATDLMKVRASKMNSLFTDYGPFEEYDIRKDVFPSTLYKIFRRAIQGAVPDTKIRSVRSLASYQYDDGTPILTITTIVGPIEKIESVVEETQLNVWPLADINWRGPTKIIVPHLSLRERLAIDQMLPAASAETIMRRLKLWLEKDEHDALETMKNYIQLYNHVPQFLRVNV